MTEARLTGQSEPYVMIPNWILFHEDLSHADVRVWATLRHFWNARTNQCNPSYASIAHLSRVSVSQIRNKSISKLSQVGAIVIQPDLKGGRRTHHYHLVFTAPSASHSVDSGPERASLSDSRASLSGSPGASLSGYNQEDLDQERAREDTAVDNSLVPHHYCRTRSAFVDDPKSSCAHCTSDEKKEQAK